MTGDKQAFWLQRASREALRFNLGWWLQLFLPWVFGLGILSSVGILALRTANQGIWGLAIAAALAAFAGMLSALFVARESFFRSLRRLCVSTLILACTTGSVRLRRA